MDITALMEYFSIVIVGICLAVGYILKHAVQTDKINRFIPAIVGLIGLILNIWIKHGITPEIILGGLFSGLASTGLYEAFTNLIEGGKQNEE